MAIEDAYDGQEAPHETSAVPASDETSAVPASDVVPSTPAGKMFANEITSLLRRASDGQKLSTDYINARVEAFLMLFRPLLAEIIKRGSQEDIGQIRHDAGNMLTVIDNFLRDSANFDNPEAIADAKESVARLHSLLMELPTGSTRTETEDGPREVSGPVKTNLSQLVAASSSILKTEEKLCTLTNEIPADASLTADPIRLSIAFDNIIRNALEVGATEIRVSSEQLEMGENSFLQPGNYMLIRFKDNGPGIKRERLSKVLQPGVSRHKTTGRGIGLASVRATIVHHGGHLFIKSQTGDGSYTEVNILMPDLSDLVEMPGVEPGSKDEV
ncbi:MAG: HAMP domain-containing histidine kinase [Candidatus Peregrinibacteria bacterium]|nr:HAMP domain-containing histidine kinase [Candidatus Peregrinibacteria bacterium]